MSNGQSNIVTTNIDPLFPVQGKDNPSQGFRDNFNAIKTALNVAKNEITTLNNDTAKNNADNNFNGKILENAVANNINFLYKNKGLVSGSQILLNVRESQYTKIRFQGNSVVRFTNWPTTIGSIFRAHRIMLHLQFELDTSQAGHLNTRINFSTDAQGVIKSHTTGAPWYYDILVGGWHLKPWTNPNVSTNINAYEHVFEAWSYDEGNNVFLKYEGSFK